jgi:hypothetical protein
MYFLLANETAEFNDSFASSQLYLNLTDMSVGIRDSTTSAELASLPLQFDVRPKVYWI